MSFKKFGEGMLAGVLVAFSILLTTLAILLIGGFISAPIVFFVFLILKLVGTITFGWFYVFLPLIIFFVGLILSGAIAYICGGN